MKVIELTRGRHALVDDEDHDYLSQFSWRLLIANESKKEYAIRTPSKLEDPKRRSVYMHRALMNPPPGLLVDHRDGNGLNNQRANLRVATHLQNHGNQRARAGKRWPKGVTREWGSGKWVARITFDGVETKLGPFDDMELAHAAYLAKARELFGEFADEVCDDNPFAPF